MQLRGFAIACAISIVLSGCSVNEDQARKEQEAAPVVEPAVIEADVTDDQNAGFDENQAVAAVLKEKPDFPPSGQAKEIEVVTGGKAPGTKVKGTLSTTVAASSSPGKYTVTLMKNLDYTINEEVLRGYWIYEVTPEETRLVESNDNTILIETVK
ncbi:hypothetical protein J2T15_005509 [Paenibacillus harenae]|uniref:Carboxypeptidase regulatory-like domain-containing protein n=1 Tax=Paenibacillus harenae TaxID=306543 RepID=A0ABT9UAI1_PAEHA|nr:hypothetical protein [Paenibacillus harenae]